ncbi:rod shape-determining protein MreC [Oceanospirillum linum]|uniref:Cell shape-determining protein MreC n=1 Tax=Oceanospirillum linum TaxID=966 RepID=A0A1T1H9B9_OCELI|nr:rod shape-determining protein MreC [Oceanospirillum linum]OOV86469.1 rod shape-determining protein MreC [Oceanospirillum linum]SEG34384.1 rod shape-determining protein MreC [Oleiphilus messinensis]SMP29447.1 rod shape-determining protein MreC [Oceanospirillum linum]
MFVKGPSLGLRLLACLILSLALMFSDYRYQHMDQVRSFLTVAVTPLQWAVDLPNRLWSWGAATFSDRNALLEENALLKEQALQLSSKNQRMAYLIAENLRLRELLNAKKPNKDRFLLGEVIGLDADAFTHQVLVNRGRRDGVYEGQAVVDALGLMGQVVSVSTYTSRVLLAADTAHAVPVLINRNGFRVIAIGSGLIDELTLSHVPDTADIREGDLLVTSGLAGRFPKGYPVAEVSTVRHEPGKPFATVSARPLAQLERSRYVLMLNPLDVIDNTNLPVTGSASPETREQE